MGLRLSGGITLRCHVRLSGLSLGLRGLSLGLRGLSICLRLYRSGLSLLSRLHLSDSRLALCLSIDPALLSLSCLCLSCCLRLLGLGLSCQRRLPIRLRRGLGLLRLACRGLRILKLEHHLVTGTLGIPQTRLGLGLGRLCLDLCNLCTGACRQGLFSGYIRSVPCLFCGNLCLKCNLAITECLLSLLLSLQAMPAT